jgi:glycosyltransferase involved in cell wall biosynthesis
MTKIGDRLKGARIARVSTVAFFIETQLISQICSIVEEGGEVTVVASEEKLSRPALGAKYFSINIPRQISPFRDLVALIRLWLYFRRSAFDIVHSTTPKAGLLCSVAAKLAGVPIRLHTFTGQPWVGASGLKRLLAIGAEKLISRLNTHCYTDSHSQRDFIIEHGIASPEQLSVLGSGSLAGIDLKRFNPARFSKEGGSALKFQVGVPEDAQILLFVGRVARDKGITELLASFERVLAGGANVFLIILGPSDESEMDLLVNNLPLTISERTIMPGFSPEPERYMAIADLLVLPSYREGFGTVVIEAAAMGVPTIGTNIYGLSDAIVDGETGLLVPVCEIESLAAAINMLLHNSSLRLEMGANARARAERDFSNIRVSKLVIDDYVDLLQGHEDHP